VNDDMLNSTEAGAILSLAPRSVTYLAQTGKLPGESIWRGKRRTWMFRRADVEAYRAEQERHRGA